MHSAHTRTPGLGHLEQLVGLLSVCSPSSQLVAWIFHPNALKCPGNGLALSSGRAERDWERGG